MVTPVISANIPRFQVYTATAGQTDFPITWAYFAQDDVCAIVRRAGVVVGNYVAGDGSMICDPASDGVLDGGVSGAATIPACEAGDEVSIFGLTTPEREVVFVNPADMTRDNLNRDANRRVAVEVELRRDIGRAIRVPIGETGFDVPRLANRKGKVAVWDATTGELVAAPGIIDTETLQALLGEADIRAYGATVASSDVKGDIDDALSIGRQAHIPYSDWLTSKVTLQSNQKVSGDGPDISRLKLRNGANTDLIYGAGSDALWGSSTDAGTENIVIEGLTLDGNRANNTAGSGVSIYGQRWRMRDLYLCNLKDYGIRTDWFPYGDDQFGMEAAGDNIRIDTCGKHGWLFEGAHDSILTRVIIVNSGQDADNTWDGFRIEDYGAGQFNMIHVWNDGTTGVRNRHAIYTAAYGATFVDAHGEGAKTSQFKIDGQYTQVIGGRFYASFAGAPNVIINQPTAMFGSYLGGKAFGQPAVTGIVLGNGDVGSNPTAVNILAYAGGVDVAIDLTNGGGKNKIVIFGLADATHTGTPNEFDEININVWGQDGIQRVLRQFPGTTSFKGHPDWRTNNSIAAAGANAATATVLPADYSVYTIASGTEKQGVRARTAVRGRFCIIANATAVNIYLYPAAGDQFLGYSTNPLLLSPGETVQLHSPFGTTWHVTRSSLAMAVSVSTVTNYTALRALTPYDGQVVQVRYRTSADDDGGGPFIFSTANLSALVTLDTQSGVWVAPNSDPTGASGAWKRILTADQALMPEMFGGVGDGTTIITTACDAMITVARAGTGFRRVRFGPKRYRYEGTGMSLTGYLWDIDGCDNKTELYRTTDGPFFVYDITTGSGGVGSVGGFRAISTLADGARANTHVVKIVSGGAAFRLNTMRWHDISFSAVQDLVWFDQTLGDLFDGFNQLGRYFGHIFENCTADGNSGSLPSKGIVWSSGTGSHHIIDNCILAVLGESVLMGDGVQGVHDITIVNSHLLGVVGGVRAYGPTNPLYYRKNILIAGCQFDGNTSYTFNFDRLSNFKVLHNNSLSGVGPIITNATAPYWYTDHLGGFYSHTYEAPDIASAVNRVRLTAAATGSPVALEAVGSDTNIGINVTPKANGQITLGGGSPIVSSTNGIVAAGAGGMRRAVDTDYLRLAGGSSISNGALISLYGGTHASLAKRAYFNADLFDFSTQDGVTPLLAGTTTRVKLGVPLELASFTVSTLPSGAVARNVYATNLRVFNGAGTQEGAAAGTGGSVEHNGSAWKIPGTNVTAVA